MNIKEIRENVLKMMENRYKNNPTFINASDEAIEKKFFLRKEDSAAVRKSCEKHKFIVSFRKAGEHTLTRISTGNPCKGHDITSKSIKEKGTAYTYNIDEATFENYKGLIGYSDLNNSNLKGLWKINNKKSTQVKLEDIRPSDNLTEFFTGDYDLHDLIKSNNRILASTIDEKSALDQLNNAMLANDEIRKQRVNQSLSENQRKYTSPYALIRHGAQTSFISYLLSEEGKEELVVPDTARLPLEGLVTTIDPDIVVFTSNGEAYILNDISHVYFFYKKYDMLNQVPFYYFFDDLKKDELNREKLDSYSIYINNLLKKSLHKA